MRAAEEALHTQLYDDFWEYMKEVRKRPEIRAAEAAWSKAITEFFSPEVFLRRKSRARRGRRQAASP